MESEKSDLGNMGNNEADGLTKAKKPRKPMSEASRQNLLNGQKKRLENIQKRKEEKLAEAQRALLEKEGYVKKVEAPQPIPAVAVEAKVKKTSKKEKEVFKNTVLEEQEPLEVSPPDLPSKKPAKQRPAKLAKKKPIIVYDDEDSDEEGESTEESSSEEEEEIIVIKKRRQQKPKKRETTSQSIVIPTKKSVRVTNEDSLANSGQDWRSYFM